MTPITLLIADDHAIVRKGIRSCLTPYKHIRVLGEARNGEEAVRKASTLKPDVILLDISMPKMSGLDVIPLLRRSHPNARILILTIHNSKEYLSRSVKTGADGFVLKDAEPSEIKRAIEAVYHGGAFFSPGVSKEILGTLAGEEGQELSRREREVLILIAEGFSSSEIAGRLFISERTVATHRQRIMKKLDIHTIAGLTKYAITQGLLKDR
jgi:two-component system nitrate/nitrite response regulator NarL